MRAKPFYDAFGYSCGFLTSKMENLRFKCLWDSKPGTSIKNERLPRRIVDTSSGTSSKNAICLSKNQVLLVDSVHLIHGVYNLYGMIVNFWDNKKMDPGFKLSTVGILSKICVGILWSCSIPQPLPALESQIYKHLFQFLWTTQKHQSSCQFSADV